MIAQPPAAIGCFAILVASLLLSTINPAKSIYWIAEIEGSSMTPTLYGARQAFTCLECKKTCEFELPAATEVSVYRCTFCNTWQRGRGPSEQIAADRVLLTSFFDQRDLRPGAIVAIDHPIFGLTGKRITSVCPDGYYVLGDNRAESIDSRNPRFGIVPPTQIRGIVVRILPARPLAAAKRSR